VDPIDVNSQSCSGVWHLLCYRSISCSMWKHLSGAMREVVYMEVMENSEKLFEFFRTNIVNKDDGSKV